MGQAWDYGPVTTDDAPAMAGIMSAAFNSTEEESAQWISRSGIEHLRVLRRPGGEIGATLLRIPMGQFFGARSVPMLGVAGVAVAPAWRGGGAATLLMRRALEEARAEGLAISTLYAATQTLYRRVGYEQAGHAFDAILPVNRIDVRDRTLPVREACDADAPAIRACYARVAPGFDGHLDRAEYIWRRVRAPRNAPARGFVVEGPGGVEGYVYLSQIKRENDPRHDLRVSDACATTPAAARRLLTLIADFGSMAVDLSWSVGPTHPLLMLLGEQRYTVTLRDWWMVRLVDLERAIAARGFIGAPRAEAHLEVRDEVLPANAGRWVVRTENGRGHAERGGRGELALDAGALASLYAGFASATSLRMIGRAAGSDGAVAAADAVFPTGCPWTPDHF